MNKLSVIIILSIFFLGCNSSKEEVDISETDQIKNESNSFNKYIDSVFIDLENLTISNSDVETLRKYRRNKTDSTVFLKRKFVENNLCSLRNICYDDFLNNEYYPIGKIKLNAKYTLLIYENFKRNRFPLLFDEVYVALFDIDAEKVKDKLLIFRDYDGGPINCGEIDFSINSNEVNVRYKKCKKFPPRSEDEKYYKNMTIVNERYVVENDKFLLNKKEQELVVFDTYNRVYINEK